MDGGDLDVEFERVSGVPRNAKRVGHRGRSIPLTPESRHGHSIVADDAEVYSTAHNESYVTVKRKKEVKLVHEGKVTLQKGTYRVRIKSVGEGQFAEILREAGISMPVEEFIGWISAGIRSVADPTAHADPKAQFTQADVKTLKRGGFSFAESKVDHVAETVARYVALLHESLSTAEVADRLGVTQGRIRQQLIERSMFGIKLSGEWRIPLFQFSKGNQIRGIDTVLRELSPDLHPVEVWDWFQNPDPDLTIDETLLSPLRWLESGGDPRRVADLAADI